MSGPVTTHPLADLVRRPVAFSLATAGFGTAAYSLSLVLPVGATALALACLGAAAGSAGLLTASSVVLAKATGLASRSERAVRQGRPEILFPGARPPMMYLPPAQRTIDLTDGSRAAALDQVPAPAGR